MSPYSPWKDKVVQRFGAQAAQYQDYNDLQEQTAETLAGFFPALQGRGEPLEILEIGCGIGTLSAHLFKAYPAANFTITDISPAMLAQAQEAHEKGNRHGDISWAVLDGENLETLPNDSTGKRFDLIVSNMAVQWFEHPQRSLAHLQSHLTPQGHILYSVPDEGCFKEWRATLDHLGLESGLLEFQELSGLFHREDIVMNYKEALDFLRSIKRIGAGTPNPSYHPMSAQSLRSACRYFDCHYRGEVTWAISYGRISCGAS